MPHATRPSHVLCLLAAAAGCLAVAPAASAQLRPENVLVVYDSRISTSLTVAEYYAGSAAVAGGTGGRPGTRAGVRTVNLQTLGTTAQTAATIDRGAFNAQIRNPLRQWLTANDPAGTIRVLVTTKGLPHRIENVGSPSVGDNPAAAGDFYSNGNYNCAALDSELSLLWQNLETGETGGNVDSKLDGFVLNPYWKQTLPITGWLTTNRTAAKTWFTPATNPASNIGEMWSGLVINPRLAATPAQLTPGDMYLVCRLDGNTIANVQAMLDRAAGTTAGASAAPGAGIATNCNTAGFVLDESGSDGSQTALNGNANEYDNQTYDIVSNGDDYEQTRDQLITDRRFLSTNIKYDASSNAASFQVGALVSYGGQGRIIDTLAAPLPVILLAHYGANHLGTAPGDGVSGSPNPRTTYATSFTYAPAAVFNSLESFNGRSFGGIGPGSVAQQQLADFIGAGGTFGIGNVYEPFTITIADNALIVRNFHTGNLTWAEAAYTAMPALSFQQIVIGDPLARITRNTEDRDGDTRVSIDDLFIWNASPIDINRTGGIGNDADRRFVEDATRATRDADMRGTQR